MTAFYDRTGLLVRWCVEEQLAPLEAIEILRERLAQAKEYLLWVGPQVGIDPANPQLHAPPPSEGVVESTWRGFVESVALIEVPTQGRDFWGVCEATFERLERAVREAREPFTASQFYAVRIRGERLWQDILPGPFGVLHAVSHQFKGRFSDSPQPRRRGKARVRDSDAWLRERHPRAPR